MQLDKYSLFEQGLFIENMTERIRLNKLISKLAPVKTAFELVRLGSNNDGGYLVPNDLAGISACFSPGVDVNASFEADLLRKYDINSHLADFSVDGPPSSFEPLSFTKKYIGAMNDDMHMTMDYWVRSHHNCEDKKDLLLQMDIEGSEYVSLIACPEETLKQFRIVVIELHDIEAWGQPNFFRMVETFFDKILRHFIVVHSHPNNCCGLVNLGGTIAPRVFELSLLRNDRASPLGYYSSFPHPLDGKNVVAHPDLILPENWRHPNEIID